jgi:spermidine/putrescine transport system permease protein
MVNGALPIAITLSYISLERINTDLLEASYDLGASGIYTFRKITLPLSAPGVVAAAILIFVITLADEAIPQIMGGMGTYTVGMMMVSVFNSQQIPLAGAISVIILLIVGIILAVGQQFTAVKSLFEEIET